MLLRRVARPMLAALFIQGGINAMKAPEGHAAAAKPVFDAMAPAVDRAVEMAPIGQRPDDEMLIKIDAGVKIAAGTLLAFGKYPRLAATALAATLVPTTLAGHRFWEETDPQRKQEQQIHFMKNVGLLGGLLIAAADTEGKPSLGWRGRKAAKLAAAATAAQAGAISGTASDVTGRVSGAVHDVGGKVTGSAHDAGGAAAGLAAGLAGIAPAAASSRASRRRADLSSRAGEISADWSRRAAKAQHKAEKRAAKLQQATEKRGAEMQARAAKRSAELQKHTAKRLEKAAPLRDQAGKLGHDVAARAAAVSHEVAHQAEGLAKDARKRAHALSH
ncbi:DoxX family protein [Pseudonocardia sp. MH-G8]|uniref:DoxX family protein n=1 Tax=Pseudonocardia sp. MH-G8 TaxID=1854588 RepID=UPI000BA1317F|nr:DoxX family protein [Pseudonocardia sp. MH-G8]OZM77808.1 DoxX family protein [Pseudonocardia sp. MH-G8]